MAKSAPLIGGVRAPHVDMLVFGPPAFKVVTTSVGARGLTEEQK
ncbi:MAG TPA: hypothetical protein VK201_09600 [bacterium]|nr:hypothetical protein [bacterium]